MRKIVLTCPLTGADFSALEFSNNTLMAKNSITGDMFTIEYCQENDAYMVPREFFSFTPKMSMIDAAMHLGVSRQRMSAIAKNKTIQPIFVNGQTMFKTKDVIEYGYTRKVGAPKKEQA